MQFVTIAYMIRLSNNNLLIVFKISSYIRLIFNTAIIMLTIKTLI